MQVKHLDWSDALAAEQHCAHIAKVGSNSAQQTSKQWDESSSQTLGQPAAPQVPAHDQYDVIIGTDILYEVP